MQDIYMLEDHWEITATVVFQKQFEQGKLFSEKDSFSFEYIFS